MPNRYFYSEIFLNIRSVLFRSLYLKVFVMSITVFGVLLYVFLFAFDDKNGLASRTREKNVSFKMLKYYHEPKPYTDQQLKKLSSLTDNNHMNEVLDNICIVRVVGTPTHKAVNRYIKNSMKNLGWTVENDTFVDYTPAFGNLQFENIIAKLNPNAKRYLTLACHYDSKYETKFDFEGATDSAVPCMQMINLARVMKKHLNSVKNNDVSLMFLFLDGEEAFKTWGPKDSIYGARNLARKWEKGVSLHHNEYITELDKIDLFVLLDLIGAPDPKFYNYFTETTKWYYLLSQAETALAKLRQFNGYSYEKPEQKYFRDYTIFAGIQDDHLPFLERRVPILHLIPSPFPDFWHAAGDNRNNISMSTIENINKILRVFVASYLNVNI